MAICLVILTESSCLGRQYQRLMGCTGEWGWIAAGPRGPGVLCLIRCISWLLCRRSARPGSALCGAWERGLLRHVLAVPCRGRAQAAQALPRRVSRPPAAHEYNELRGSKCKSAARIGSLRRHGTTCTRSVTSSRVEPCRANVESEGNINYYESP